MRYNVSGNGLVCVVRRLPWAKVLCQMFAWGHMGPDRRRDLKLGVEGVQASAEVKGRAGWWLGRHSRLVLQHFTELVA